MRARAGLLAAATLALALAAPRAADAAWKDVRHVTYGTAWVLDKGEFEIGLLGPLSVGISDRLTLQTHVIYDVLLTPNVAARYLAWDGPVGLSVAGGFAQSVFQLTDRRGAGELWLGPLATWPLGDRLSLTGALRYAAHIDPGTPHVFRHGLSYGAAAHLLIGPLDLIHVAFDQRYDVTVPGLGRPSVLLLYIHAFDGWDLAGGVNIGEFRLRDAEHPDDLSRATTLPVFPVADVRWRF